jgi:hypothetical protein
VKHWAGQTPDLLHAWNGTVLLDDGQAGGIMAGYDAANG